MAFQKFHEYMNNKGTINKVKIDASGDNVDMPKGRDAKPPKSEKTMKTTEEGGKVKKETTGDHKPYVSKGKKTVEKWDSVNPELKYEPNTKTENFVSKTKNMNIAEFVKHITSQYSIKENTNIPTISTPHGEFIPQPHEAINLTRFLVLNNGNFMETFIREVKRHDGMNALVMELLKHPEAYSEIAAVINEDEDISRRLVRSLNLSEIVSVPKHKEMPGMEMGDEDEDEIGPQEEDDMEMGEEDDEDEDMEMGDEGEEEGEEDEEGLSLGSPENEPAPSPDMLKKKMGMHYLKKAMNMM